MPMSECVLPNRLHWARLEGAGTAHPDAVNRPGDRPFMSRVVPDGSELAFGDTLTDALASDSHTFVGGPHSRPSWPRSCTFPSRRTLALLIEKVRDRHPEQMGQPGQESRAGVVAPARPQMR